MTARAGAIQTARSAAHRAQPPRADGADVEVDEEDDLDRRSQGSRNSSFASPPLNRITNSHAVRQMLLDVNAGVSGSQMRAS